MEQIHFRSNGDVARRQGNPSEPRPLKPEDWVFDKAALSKMFFQPAEFVIDYIIPSRPVASEPDLNRSRDALKPIADAIEKSRDILKLPVDWDDEGSPPYSQKTLVRATEFLWNQAVWFWEHESVLLDTPRIAPGPDGSIDILWKSDSAELLINVPIDRNSQLAFYGDTKAGSHISGSIKDSDYKKGLWFWLKEEASWPRKPKTRIGK